MSGRPRGLPHMPRPARDLRGSDPRPKGARQRRPRWRRLLRTVARWTFAAPANGSEPAPGGWTRGIASALAAHYDPSTPSTGCFSFRTTTSLSAGTGFRTHPHQDMEIVTWVLEGELEHKDSGGEVGDHLPGVGPADERGHGDLGHSEMNPRHDTDVHFVQMWVPPDTERIRPGLRATRHQRGARQGRSRADRLGRGHAAAISIRQRGAVLWAGR